MRIFYLFDVNEHFYDMYKGYPYKLYKLFEDIYLTSRYNLDFANRMYSQITYKYNKSFTNNFIKNSKRIDPFYSFKNNLHVLNGKYDHCTLCVYKYYIRINSNFNYTGFFNDLISYSKNIFVCDFDNLDYFWLESVTVDKMDKIGIK